MHRNLIIGGLFVIVILLIGVAESLRSQDDSGVSAVPPAVRPSPATQYRSIALQIHHTDSHPYEQFIDEIAATGANTITLVIHAYQENIQSEAIFIDARKTVSNRRLGELIDYAHQKPLRVALMPVVLLAKAKGQWRGQIKPENWDEWWKDYRKFILQYAYIAGEHTVELFSVGSELVTTELQEDRWRGLIAEVRTHAKGHLTYSANWDHYQAARWWDAVDIVGMTSYYTLAKGEGASLAALLEGWTAPKQTILDWQKSVGRPILFSEVGWPNQATASEYAWNYYKAPNRTDPQLQKRCFESFFQTWAHEPAVAGYTIWEWRNDPNQDTHPTRDSSYCPRGKPAMDVIRTYLQKP